jgi:Lrp/AsnC family leucine-responsive transcriptional regulator
MLKMELDRTDRRILEVLQQNGRITNAELANRVALSPSPCLRRLHQLEESGVIKRYVALLDPWRVGLGLHAFVTVSLEKRGAAHAESFRRAVEGWPEVLDCYAMTGEMDYLLRVMVTDLEHFSRFVMDRLLKHEAVTDVKSSFVLQEIKHTTALPLNHLDAE